jgi:hypothetical protein
MALSDLQGMLRGLTPTPDETAYVFASVPNGSQMEQLSAVARGLFVEEEGVTFIVPADRAHAHGLPDEPRFRRIVLNVHSSLEGIGLTASVSAALASAGIPCNMVAAFHHDHVFVPEEMTLCALGILRELQRQATEASKKK